MRTHDHSGRAVTALEAVFFPEAFLEWMKLPILSHAFDRYDVCAVCLNRKYRARLDREAIGQDRTGATNTGFATNVGAGQAGHIADEVRLQKPRLDVFVIELPINLDLDVHTRVSLVVCK